MLRRLPALLFLAAFLSAAGCATQCADNFHAVRTGLTMAEVEDLLGKPSSTWTEDEGLVRWQWGDTLSSLATSSVFQGPDSARVWVVWFDGAGAVTAYSEPDWARER